MGGGIGILCNEKIKHQPKKDLTLRDNENLESVFIKMTCKNHKNIIIESLYILPNTSETEFLNSYDYLLNKLKLESKKEVVLGLDHNFDLLNVIYIKHQTSSRTKPK